MFIFCFTLAESTSSYQVSILGRINSNGQYLVKLLLHIFLSWRVDMYVRLWNYLFRLRIYCWLSTVNTDPYCTSALMWNINSVLFFLLLTLSSILMHQKDRLDFTYLWILDCRCTWGIIIWRLYSSKLIDKVLVYVFNGKQINSPMRLPGSAC